MDPPDDIRFAIFEALRRARDDPLKPLVPEHFAFLVPRDSPRKAPGVGVLTMADVQRIPEPAMSDLTCLLDEGESSGIWPQQFFCHDLRAPPQAQSSGGSRDRHDS